MKTKGYIKDFICFACRGWASKKFQLTLGVVLVDVCEKCFKQYGAPVSKPVDNK